MRAATTAPADGVLYDAPGPRARRLSRLGGGVTVGVLVIGCYLVVIRPLAENGIFAGASWAPLVDPTDPVFGLVWRRIGHGALGTLTAAGLAIVAALLAGTALAVLRVEITALSRRRFGDRAALARLLLRLTSRTVAGLTRVFVDVFRGLPVVLTIFFAGRGLPELGLAFDDDLWYVVIGLGVYNGVVIGELLRAGMAGLPGGQAEAASALGLGRLQTTGLVLLPQAYRVMLPALISQLVVVLKDTSLGFIVSYEETLEVAKQIIGSLGNPIPVYFVIGAGFVLVNYALSRLAGYLERRVTRGRTAAGE